MREGLLIDAYNLYHAARASAHARLFPDLKRLAYFLEHYASHHGLRVMLVVDGTRYSDEFTDTSVLEVLFSDGGQSADAVMEAWMAKLELAERLAWALVSNDLNLCRMGVGMGLRTRPCEALVADLAAFARKTPEPITPPKNPNFKRPFNNPFGHLALAAAFLIFAVPAKAVEFGGFAEPDSAVSDPVTAAVYVSNVGGSSSEKDNNGFISKISGDGLIIIQKFIRGSTAPEAHSRRLNAPKGMAVFDGNLYVADIDTIRVYRLETGEPISIIKFRRRTPTFLTGIAVGKKGELFVSDLKGSIIYRLDTRAGNLITIYTKHGSMVRPQGIWFDPITANLFVVTSGKGSLYRIGSDGQAHLMRKGLGALGGITGDEFGNIYVSGTKRGEIYRIADHGRGELTQSATGLFGPVGIGYDMSSGSLMIPQSTKSLLTILPLRRTHLQFSPKNKNLKN